MKVKRFYADVSCPYCSVVNNILVEDVSQILQHVCLDAECKKLFNLKFDASVKVSIGTIEWSEFQDQEQDLNFKNIKKGKKK